MDQGQLHRTHDREDPHHHAGGLHSVTEEADQHQHQHGEKKSVLTKVKNKARKIKDKIKHAGHTHDIDDDEEYDYEYEETVNHPHLHAAPVASESDFISGTALPKQTGHNLEPKQTGLNLENPTGLNLEDRLARDHDVGVTTGSKIRNAEDDPLMKAPSPQLQGIYHHNSPNIGAQDFPGTTDVGIGRKKVESQPPAGTQDVYGATDRIGRENVVPLPPVGTQDFSTGREKMGAQHVFSGGATDVGIGRKKAGSQPPVGTHDFSGATDLGMGREEVGSQPPFGAHQFSGATDIGIGREKVGAQPPVHDFHDFSGTTDVGIGRKKAGSQPPPFGAHDFSGATDVGFGREIVGPQSHVGREAGHLPTSVNPTVKIGPLEGLEVDPHGPNASAAAVPSSNYQSKIADPAGLGGGEADVTPLLKRLDNFHVDDDDSAARKNKSEETDYMVSHEHFAPGSFPASEQFTPKSFDSEMPESVHRPSEMFIPKSFDAERPESMPQDTAAGKISAAASVVTDKAAAAKNAVASKLGYGGSTLDSEEMEEDVDRPPKASLTDKAVAAKNAVASKLGYGGSNLDSDEMEGEVEVDRPPKASLTDKAVAAKDAVASKLGYGGSTLDREQMESTLDREEMEVDRPPKASLTDKAVAAKNAVASKLGYGGSTLDSGEMEVDVDRPPKASLTETVSEYGHKVAEQLAPVYEKAAGAGSTIMSKVPGLGGGGEREEVAVGKESDRGASVQSYLVEKLSPGEEDRELSKAITEAIHGKKEGAHLTGEEKLPMQPVEETVTVEAVVADEKAAAGVVDRVKGAIGSWLGKKDDGVSGEGLEKEIVDKLKE